MIFKKEIKMVPDRIFILNGLDITYNDVKCKIYLNKDNKNYKGIKIKFNDQ